MAENTPNPADYDIRSCAFASPRLPAGCCRRPSAPTYYIGPASVPYLDWVAMMGYDMAAGQHAGWNDSIQRLNSWAASGIPKAKLLLGVPFYGKNKQEFPAFYGKIVDNAHPSPDVDQVYDPVLRDTWYYNGVGTMQKKARYVLDGGYGGIMIWELGEDHFDAQGRDTQWSLLPAIYSVAASSMLRAAPTPSAGIS